MPNDFNLEHPEIGWMERTGYPSFAQPEIIRCEVCEEEIDEDDVYEDTLHECICGECLLRTHRKGW